MLALVATGAAGCTGIFQKSLPEKAASFVRSADGAMRAGSAEADITPEGYPYLGGFDLNRRATEVFSKLAVRALVLEVDRMRIAIVGIDNLGLQRHDAEWIKDGLLGFTNGCVFLCSSHTHAGPDLIGLWGKYFLTSGRDREYVTLVRAAVRRAVSAATARLRSAKLVRGEARVTADTFIRNSNRAGVFDPRVTVLQAVAVDDGAPLGTLLHAACHPEVLRRGNDAISADFVGPLCDLWKSRGHGQAVFVNGALGAMISPKTRGREQVEPSGAQLCDAAEQALAAARPVEGSECVVRRRDVYLPMQSWALRIARLTAVIPRHVYGGCIRTSVGYLRIGDFEACCVPGEAEPGYARRIVAASGRSRLLLFGLVDDEVGYLMSEKDARDPLFAYERTMSPGVTAGELVLDALVGPDR